MARAMHHVRNVVAAVDMKGLAPGQTANIHTCMHKILQLCKKYAADAPTCAFYFFDSSLSPKESKLKAERACGSPGAYAAFSTPDQLYDPFSFALDELEEDLEDRMEESEVNMEGRKEESEVMSGEHDVADSTSDALREALLCIISELPWHVKGSVEGLEQKTWETQPNLLVLFTPWLRLHAGCQELSVASFLVPKLKVVSSTLLKQGIHLCWIHVPEPYDDDCSDAPANRDVDRSRILEHSPQQLSLRTRFAKLKWSFWDLELLIAGSTALPFCLLWPCVAFPALRLPCREAYTSADILVEVDSCGKAETQAVSHVELYDLTFLQPGSNGVSSKKCCSFHDAPKRIPGEGASTVLVTKLLPKHEALANWLRNCDTFLMWACSKTEAVKGEEDCELPEIPFFQLLQQDRCEFEASKPSWQLFLLHLARARAAAVVQFSQYGSTYAALVEPLTVHCATLSIITSDQGALLATISNSPNLKRLTSCLGIQVGRDLKLGNRSTTEVKLVNMTTNPLENVCNHVDVPLDGVLNKDLQDDQGDLEDAQSLELSSQVLDGVLAALAFGAGPETSDIALESVNSEKAEKNIPYARSTPQLNNSRSVETTRDAKDLLASLEHESVELLSKNHAPWHGGSHSIGLSSEGPRSPRDAYLNPADHAKSIESGTPQQVPPQDSEWHLEVDLVVPGTQEPDLVKQQQDCPTTSVDVVSSRRASRRMECHSEYKPDENLSRHELEIKRQLHSVVSQGLFSDQEIHDLGVEITRLMERLFLSSRRGVPKVQKSYLQTFFSRYLDPFPVVFQKVCQILDEKGWIMIKLRTRPVRNRIRRQELRGYRNQETYVQIRRKRPSVDLCSPDRPVGVPEDTSNVVAGKKQRVISPKLLKFVQPRFSCSLPRVMNDEMHDFSVFDFNEEDSP